MVRWNAAGLAPQGGWDFPCERAWYGERPGTSDGAMAEGGGYSFALSSRRSSPPGGTGSVRFHCVCPAAIGTSVVTLGDENLVFSAAHHVESL